MQNSRCNEAQEETLPALIAARLLLQTVSIAGIVDHPDFRRDGAVAAQHFLAQVSEVLPL